MQLQRAAQQPACPAMRSPLAQEFAEQAVHLNILEGKVGCREGVALSAAQLALLCAAIQDGIDALLLKLGFLLLSFILMVQRVSPMLEQVCDALVILLRVPAALHVAQDGLIQACSPINNQVSHMTEGLQGRFCLRQHQSTVEAMSHCSFSL